MLSPPLLARKAQEFSGLTYPVCGKGARKEDGVLDLRQLEALAAVHAEGSVTGAARALQWSQPTVDYHLKNLERIIGSAVLQRSPRGSVLTPVGVLLLERGAEILTLRDRALRDAQELAEIGRVSIRFGMFPTAAAKLLPPVVEHLSQLGIGVDVALEEMPVLVDRVNRAELDAALVYTVPGYELPLRPRIVTTDVHPDPLLLALPVGHRLAGRSAIDVPTLLTLSDERWVFGTAVDDPMDVVVVDTFAPAGRSLDVAYRTDDFQVMLAIIAAGMAIGMVPSLVTTQAHPGVVLIPVSTRSFSRTLQLASATEGPSAAPSTAVRHLAAALRAASAGLRG